MVKNFNSKPIIVSTNFEMGACYDDLNTPICFGGSESPLPGTRPGEYFPGHFSRSFRCLEKILGYKMYWTMSQDRVLLLYLR